MRTSLTDIRCAEEYLAGKMDTAEKLVFEARQLTHPQLAADVSLLQRVYSLLRFYHRRKLKAEAEAVHRQLFSDPAKKEFRQRLLDHFKK
jgi:hypothetical protein